MHNALQTAPWPACRSVGGRPCANGWGIPVTAPIHPVATHHLPPFVTPPGETDILLVVAMLILVGSVLGVGLIFLRLHTLPERMAHKAHKLQFEIVAVLGLLALFTHNHLFWVIGLFLALVEIPDVWTPLRRMAGSLEKIAGQAPGAGADASKAAAEAALSEQAAKPEGGPGHA